MKVDLKEERFWLITLGVIAVIAILIKQYIGWFSLPDLLDALIDFAQVGVAVIVFIIAKSLKEKSVNFLEIGKQALEEVQKRHPLFVVGPKYNMENYDPEKGKGLQYLFITNQTQKVKFIPLKSLEDGILFIYVQKGTLVYGLNFKSEQASADAIKSIQKSINDALTVFIQKNYSGQYEVVEAKDDTAIIINFDETRMKQKNYRNAIIDCADLAIAVLQKHKK